MLNPRKTPGANVSAIENGWRLEIPAGQSGSYRLAQLDNYLKSFPLSAPATLNLRCRVSETALPGTWGFGFWNDPFAVSFGLQGAARRLPVLPNAAWFFHASSENHLSLSSHLPTQGFLAQSFSSPKIPSLLLAPGLLTLPLLLWKPTAKRLRASAAKIIREDGLRLQPDVTQWHEYKLKWSRLRTEYALDGETVFETATSPRGPLGLVVWIDNQFAAFPPDGSLRAGTQANPAPAWMEITNLEIG